MLVCLPKYILQIRDFFFLFDRCLQPLPPIQSGFILKTSVSYQGSGDNNSFLLPLGIKSTGGRRGQFYFLHPYRYFHVQEKEFELRQRRLMHSDDDLSVEPPKSERTEFQDSRDVLEATVLTQLRERDCNATSETKPLPQQE